jgi:O-antigen/teichoic acid export membrane protein
MELDAGLYERQMAGIAALIALANDVSTASRSTEIPSGLAAGKGKQGRLAALWAQFRQDQMMRDSLYLVLNVGLLAGFGFSFWILTAHLFSVSDVGRASALISAIGLIGNFSLFGLNTGMGRYLPDSRNQDALISSGIGVVAVSGGVGAIIYLLLIPVVAPGLSFVEKSPALAVGFILISSASSLNTLTDAIFVALRRAKYTIFVDGLVGGFGKILSAVVLVGAGTYGLFVASAMGIVLASLASVILIYTVMRSRLDLKSPLKTLQPLFKFAGANYIGNVFNMVPGLAVPIILLDRLDAASVAYFFVVFQIVQIVYAAALALEQTFLAEGSRADADMRALKRRSIRMLVMFCVPAALGIIAIGRFLLLAFGHAYATNGFASLIILSLAAGPIAANYWLVTVLRLAGKLRAIVAVNAIYAAATCMLTWIGASHGLTGVAAGWFFGALIGTCAAAAAAREGRARHQEVTDDARWTSERYPPAGHPESPRRMQRPANPFEPRIDRDQARVARGYPAAEGGGQRPGQMERPASRAPRAVNGMGRPAGPVEPGYAEGAPHAANGGYPPRGNAGRRGHQERPADGAGRTVNGAGRSANRFEPGYHPDDPWAASAGYAPEENAARRGRKRQSASPNELSSDHGMLHGEISHWD